MNRWLILFAATTASIAHAEDLNENNCDDAFEGNSACVSNSASVDGSTTVGSSSQIGDDATVGAQLAIGSGVTIGDRASLAGRVAHADDPLVVGDNVIVGRSATIGSDASLAADTVVGRSSIVGERLTTGAGAQIGYGASLGDDVTLGADSVVGNLAEIGSHAELGSLAVVGRLVTIADAANSTDGTKIYGIVGPNTNIGERVTISPGARVRKDATLDDGALILGSARVGRNTTIGPGASVRGHVGANATVHSDAIVQAGAHVLRGTTVCSAATVPSGTIVNTVYPVDGCLVPASCLDIYEDDNSSTDGIYTLDPDGAGGDPGFDAYCDMTNGGWTLAMRTADSGNTFTFLSSHWTTASTVNPTSLDPTTNSDGKFTAFNEVEGDEIRGCLRNITTGVYGCKSYDLPSEQTLLEMFTNTPIGSRDTGKGYFFTETQSERLEWVSMWGRSLSEGTTGQNYIDTGINIDDDLSSYRSRVRFGLALNGQSSINTLDDTIGFGASSYYSNNVGGLVESPWRVSGGAAFNSSLISTRGHIWVR